MDTMLMGALFIGVIALSVIAAAVEVALMGIDAMRFYPVRTILCGLLCVGIVAASVVTGLHAIVAVILCLGAMAIMEHLRRPALILFTIGLEIGFMLFGMPLFSHGESIMSSMNSTVAGLVFSSVMITLRNWRDTSGFPPFRVIQCFGLSFKSILTAADKFPKHNGAHA